MPDAAMTTGRSSEDLVYAASIRLDAIVKAYDVRGLVGTEFDADVARALGVGFGIVSGAAEHPGTPAGQIVVSHDMRPSAVELVPAFIDGVLSTGANVMAIGLMSTDGMYFASGSLGSPGAMFTASHNPAAYNGVKLCYSGARPMGQETGLPAVRDIAATVLAGVGPAPAPVRGALTETDLLTAYAKHLLALVPLEHIRPLSVVIDAGNGMAGHTAPAVFAMVPQVKVFPLYFELDGTFPNHEANPIDAANLVDLQRAVVEHGADLGLAFDGDADRCFVIDGSGRRVDPSTLTGLIAVREIAAEKAAGREDIHVIHNLITSRSVPEIIREHGATPVRTRVGHSYIKATMETTGAIFGGEHSGHFYFRDFWRADSGMLAALHTLAALASEIPGTKLADMLAPYERYAASGEINSTVLDVAGTTARIRANFEGKPGVTIDTMDGTTVSGPTWWFNLRPSNTEPLLRLNVEAPDQAAMELLRDRVLTMVRG